MSFINNIQTRFKQANIVEQLIYINVGVFVATLLFSVFSNLYVSQSNFIVYWFSLNSDVDFFITKPWTIISYGFLHADFIHILFNLIVLYYFGNLFIQYFTPKQLLTFYLLGTFVGGLIFLLSYSYFPLFSNQTVPLVGASAGVSAIIVGIATYMPNYQLKLRLIGFVKLWHLAGIFVLLDVLQLAGNNAGGHFAHLGGALFGFLYVGQASNTNIQIFDRIGTLFSFKRKPLKTVYKSKKAQPKKQANTTYKQQKINAILDKISKSGYDTLSQEEKDFLFKQGK
jgi:membrane associated rhomboid family serine protease